MVKGFGVQWGQILHASVRFDNGRREQLIMLSAAAAATATLGFCLTLSFSELE